MIRTKKLNEVFKWEKVCRVEPIWEKTYNQDGDEMEEEITLIDLVLTNGERIRISGSACPCPEDEEPLCILNIKKAKWEDVMK